MSPLRHMMTSEVATTSRAALSGSSEGTLAPTQLTHRHSPPPCGDVELGPHRHSPSVRDAEEEEEHTSQMASSACEPNDQEPRETRNNSRSHSSSRGTLASWLEARGPCIKLGCLVCMVMGFFGLHNILQEALSSTDGFPSWSLSMLEAVGVLAGSFLERIQEGTHKKRVAPFRSYVLLAGLLGMSSSLSNIALNYMTYPTKVIFRSCKLIPTMVIAVVWRKKLVSRWEFIAAGAVCAGLAIFAREDAKLEPSFNPIGIGMVMLSVCADAFLPNLQEHLFSLGASRVEVTFFTNSLTVLGMLLSTTANGNLLEFLEFAIANPSTFGHMLAYVVLSHLAIAAHMMVVKEYGGVTAVLVGNTRKAMTMALSFILFPKAFSYRFIVGAALVLGGLAANAIIKDRRRKAAARGGSKTHQGLVTIDESRVPINAKGGKNVWSSSGADSLGRKRCIVIDNAKIKKTDADIKGVLNGGSTSKNGATWGRHAKMMVPKGVGGLGDRDGVLVSGAGKGASASGLHVRHLSGDKGDDWAKRCRDEGSVDGGKLCAA